MVDTFVSRNCALSAQTAH